MPATDSLAEQKSALVRLAQRRPLVFFFVCAYLWTWIIWLSMYRIPEGNSTSTLDTLLISLFMIAAFGPTIAALVTSWLAYRNLKICSVWTGWRNLVLGLAFGLSAFFVATLVLPTAAAAKGPLSAWHWGALLHWSTYGINLSTFFGGPVNEEPGWRGFALPRLQQRYGTVRATLILAPLWAGWHLPLFWMQGWTTATPWEFLLILVGISFMFTAAANLSRFNVIVAIVLHAFFNTSSPVGNTLVQGLPRRAHEMVNYTFAVFVCGTAIGMLALAIWGKRANQDGVSAQGTPDSSPLSCA